ncbi:MAG: GNAT family N-acetyltransferase [Pseudomonadales bacterium]|jgi:putative acetyltransferase|nr:GNAT family N-acetyltransferase [Pseudomonadales bacterium]
MRDGRSATEQEQRARPLRFEIVTDDLTGDAIRAFLAEHLAEMRALSPPESTHALDVDRLQAPDVDFWTAQDGHRVLGCVALRWHAGDFAELKSMRTAPAVRGHGVGAGLLRHALSQAARRGGRRVSLETGSAAAFAPARALYARHGFRVCAPFADYGPDPNSLFMTRVL